MDEEKSLEARQKEWDRTHAKPDLLLFDETGSTAFAIYVSPTHEDGTIRPQRIAVFLDRVLEGIVKRHTG